jgi:hypothetical protein
MSEIISGTGLLLAVGAKLINDVCGPTAKYLGKEMESYTKVGIANLQRIFGNAAKRIELYHKGDGVVPPRVLKNVLQEGYFCDDQLQAEYLGGILASSKSSIARDDRGVTYSVLLSSLSSYQIRTHYLLYSCILVFKQRPWDEMLNWILNGLGITVAIDNDAYMNAMEFAGQERSGPILEHVFTGLQKHGLAEEGLSVIAPNKSVKTQPDINFRYFYPTLAGIELFLWGLGVGDRGFEAYTPDLLNAGDLPKTITPINVQLGRVSWG